MKTFKKILCTLLVVVMCLTSAPLQGFVGMEWPKLPEINFGEIKLPEIDFSKWFSSKASAKEIIDNGTCGTYGDNVTWTLYGNGEIVISGEGAMWNYRDGGIAGTYIESAPWNAYDETITQITISEGITSIGNCTFSNCINVTQIDIPESVVRIGEQAFYDCKGLIQINIPDNVVEIEAYTFYGCSSLNDIYLNENILMIGEYAFAGTKYYNTESNWEENLLYIGNYLISAKKGTTGAVEVKDGTTLIADNTFEAQYDGTINEVTLPDSLRYIGEESFSYCDIKKIIIPDDVVSIGYGAFYGCKYLSEIVISDNLIKIASAAFSNTAYSNNDDNRENGALYVSNHFIGDFNYNYEEHIDDFSPVLKIREGTITIAEWAGSGITTDIVIPDSVVYIGYGALCSDLIKTVTIGSGVKEIDEYAFPTSNTFVSITVSNSNKYLTVDSNGVLYNKDKTILYKCPGGAIIDSYDIPNSVTKISCNAFAANSSIKSITIPGSIKTISHGAFSRCEQLSDVSIFEGVEIIDSSAFSSCNFENFSIPNSVVFLGNYAFSGCQNIKTINIGSGVETIGDSMIYECSKLESITVSTLNNYYSSDNYGVLFNKNKTELKCYPVGNKQNSYTIPDSVQIISDFAFYKGIYLNDINFGGSVKEIGDNAFSETSIKSLFLPDSLIRLGSYAFSSCYKIEYLDTGDGLTSVYGDWDGGAFQGLTNLKTVVLGKNISSCWLEDSINIEKYVVDKDNVNLSVDEYGVLYNKDKTRLVDFPAGSPYTEYEIPEGVTYIGGAFSDTQNLKKVVIPSSVYQVYGFDNCKNLETVNIKYGLRFIESGAFRGCTKLVNINIPSSVTYIGEHAFENCSSLTKVTIPGSVNEIDYETFFNCSALESVIIGDGVVTISSSAFENCFSLTNVKIGSSVTSIWDDAFYNCYNLESIIIPDSVTEIDYDPFYESTMIIANKNSYAIQWAKEESHIYAYLNPATPEENIITEVVSDYLSFSIDKLARTLTVTTSGYHYLPDYSYSNVAPWQKYNPYVFNLKINEGCKSIGDRNFYQMKYLRYVDLPESLIAIDDEAFYYCYNLLKLDIPDKVTNIGKSAFAGCQRLENISFGNMVINIKEKAFNYCPKLEYITIDKNVSTIENGVFNYCAALKNVYYKGTEKQWNKISIGESNTGLQNATIHYLGDGILAGWKLNLRSVGAYSDSIAIGETIKLDVFLLKNGETMNCERAYAISFDNPGVFDIVKTQKTEESFDITLKAVNSGTTNMTVSDNVTGAYVKIKLKSDIPLDIITMDEIEGLAKNYDGIKTNFYNHNGLYVNDFYYREKRDDLYNVTMDLYNEKAHYGAVVAYDSNGNIYDFDLIQPQDKLPTSLWDTLFDAFDWVNYKAEVFGDKSYTNSVCTKESFINVDVPKGGYIAITNNYSNEIVFMANAMDLTMDLVFAVSSIPDFAADSDAISDTLNEIFLDIGSEGLKNLFKEIFKKYSEGLTMTNVCNIIYDIVEIAEEYDTDILKILKENIEYDKLIADSLESVLLSIVAKPVKSVLEGAGYINTLIKIYDLCCGLSAPQIAIYTPAEAPYKRTSNGITVTSETALDSNYVLHSYVINPFDVSMTNAKLTMEGLAPNCEMYDITLYKSGQAVQPNAKIKVMIPIPAGYNKSNIEVYWYKEDGTLIPMNATVEGDYAVFYTDHLSYYIIADQNNHIHNYVEESVVYPSCTEDGAITYSCYCGDTYVEVYSAEGHYYDEWFETKPATCENKGEKQRVCLICSDIETQEIPSTGHIFDDESECKNCGFERTENCDCSCHKTNFFARIIWKITNFFNKIFKIKKVCSCGINHY